MQKHSYRDLFYGVIIGLFLALLIKFFYFNVLVPWPYREELKSCLESARELDIPSEVKMAKDKCFRKYPHFN